MASRDIFDESGTDVAVRKFKNNPFLLVGVTGFLIATGIGAYKYKTRPKGMSTGTYLVRLRVAAQSVVVGSLTVGMVYGMVNKYILNKDDKKN
ncbi:hypothetical protein PV326_007180 [Microctonus aethiopoides]|uniref:HIG1 domain-containing protein n=1 Tax=Microctonus aethiopoides TaxID=144406 RepID=A0AA39C4T7_9HYME|nr:hypothetical protein PV326_007180 [Microctonus aethiopoides]KAK0157883.1 hypothetical protein PV328_011570 [Microctonus aethiopoides]